MDQKRFIQTKRLYVRPWQAADVDTISAVMSDPQVHVYTVEAPWTRHKSKEVVQWGVENRIGWEPGYFNCPLILRETNQLIGRVGLNPYLVEARIPEIEWTLGSAFWGQGSATEIGKAMLAYGLDEAGFAAIIGFASPKNGASRRLMLKLGMTYLGDYQHDGDNPEHESDFYSFYRLDKPV